MMGMDAKTGRAISGLAHLYQSIGRVLGTPLRSRIARRDFGAELVDLVDAPNNPATRVRLYAAAAGALMRWEPRLRLTRISLVNDATEPGAVLVDVEGTTTLSPDAVSTRAAIYLGSNQP